MLPAPSIIKPLLPAQASGAGTTTQLNAKGVRQKASTEPEKTETEASEQEEPVSKDKLITLSKHLTSSLDALNSTANKHSSNFMHLSEEVQQFYKACSNYVESLPPHGKFQFREHLTKLQNIAENLKTCSGSNAKEYDRLLTDLQSSIKDINAVLTR